jgi:hypothetical protein
MIKCISFYEELWLVRNADRQQWNHVTNAFGCSYQLFDSVGFVWDDATHNPDGWPVYVFDETGTQTLLTPTPFIHPTEAIYVFGVTGMDITQVVPPASRADIVQIDTPADVPLWGCEAAAIALAHRYLQSLSNGG